MPSILGIPRDPRMPGDVLGAVDVILEHVKGAPMTPTVAPGISCWEPIAVEIVVTIAVAGARPTIAFCFSFVLFWCNILSGLGTF
jgi:hypothetical protein